MSNQKTIAELKQITSVVDWDGENGLPTTSSQWRDVEMILMDHSICDSVIVDVCGDGYIHLLWTNANGDRGLLEVGAKHWWWSTIPRSISGFYENIRTTGYNSEMRYNEVIMYIKEFIASEV